MNYVQLSKWRKTFGAIIVGDDLNIDILLIYQYLIFYKNILMFDKLVQIKIKICT